MEEQTETLEEATSRLEYDIKNGRDMKSLLEDARFQNLFEEVYIRAFAITNVYNYGVQSAETRERIHEKMAARSHFTRFIQDIIVQGNSAVVELKELNSEPVSDDEF